MEKLPLGIMWYVVFLLSTVCHEASHALAALKLGDRTALAGGQVSLNPLPHIRQEPLGMVLVPIISFILSGWVLGWASVPYNQAWARRYPKRSAWMAMAGPAANLFLVVLGVALVKLGIELGIFLQPDQLNFSSLVTVVEPGWYSSLATVLSITISLNLILGCFNLLPFPPLDGSSIPLFFVQDHQAYKVMNFINHPQLAFFGLLIAWNVFDIIFNPIHLFFINHILYPGSFFQ